jgi:hypothetical protein
VTKTSLIALVAILSLATTVAHAAVPVVSAVDAISAAEQSAGGTAVELDLRDVSGQPSYHIQLLSKGTRLDVIVDGKSGKVSPMTGAQAAIASDATEAGEGPNDADSGNEDAN